MTLTITVSKVLVKTNQTSPNSMGLRRLITEFLWPPPAPSSDADYHIVSKYSSRRIKRAQTRWGCLFNYGVPGHLPAPSSDWLPYSISTRHNESNEPKLDGSIIRPWLPYSIKVSSRRTNEPKPRWGCVKLRSSYTPLAPSSDPDYHIVSKFRQEESNEPKLDGVASFNYEFLWPPSSSIIRPWLPYSIKVLVKRNKQPKLDGLRRLITEFLWPPSSSIRR
ncbi:hypothetical protein EVAR_57443_1 [Eumeta japonica]|uniref:Uncharacterized protein n=1 Tax=Eumeta variegata TaxID=151549 RepID=A0A4C1ZH76_EUMVA|nr:hypothetical protein EVAR_57443_1 [Eumeta japonica]